MNGQSDGHLSQSACPYLFISLLPLGAWKHLKLGE